MFGLVNFYGESNLFVGYSEEEDVESYTFNSKEDGDDRIIIPGSEIPGTSDSLYIAVKGSAFSLFTLRVYPMRENLMMLNFGYPESGIVEAGQLLVYHIQLFDSQLDSNLVFQLHQKKGKS